MIIIRWLLTIGRAYHCHESGKFTEWHRCLAQYTSLEESMQQLLFVGWVSRQNNQTTEFKWARCQSYRLDPSIATAKLFAAVDC